MSAIGAPDWQEITQWLGSPFETQDAYAIGAGSQTWGPFSVASWASVILVAEPTGGNVSFTVRANRAAAAATLNVDQSVTVAPGGVSVASFPLYGDTVYLIAQGVAGGSTVSFDLIPSNTIVQAQAITGPSSVITGIIPAAGTTPTAGTGFTYTHTNATGVYVFTFTTAFAATPVVVATAGSRAYSVGVAVTALSPSGCTVQTFNTSNNDAADAPFSFLAQAVT